MGHPPSETQPVQCDDEILNEKARRQSIPTAEYLQHYFQ